MFGTFAVTDSNPLTGLRYDALEAESTSRRLDELSDRDLICAAAAIIARPRDVASNSFLLHAPLELLARARLLTMIRPEHRALARLRIASIAAHYQTYGEPLPATADAKQAVEVAALTDSLLPGILTSTAAAAHAPILLSLASRSGLSPTVTSGLSYPLARQLDADPEAHLSWLDGFEPLDVATDAERLQDALVEAPLLGVPESDFIHPTMMQIDQPDQANIRVADECLRPVLGRSTLTANQVVQRVAAHSMLSEPDDFAQYGWTHCLTIPQACLDIGAAKHPDLALAAAATFVLGFRAAFATNQDPLRTDLTALTPEDRQARWQELFDRAAVAHDAHVAKYAVALNDAALRDNDFADHYLLAGERLLDVWKRTGDPSDPLQ